MAKLIKRTDASATPEHGSSPPADALGLGSAAPAASSRGPIIERETHEARSVAQSIMAAARQEEEQIVADAHAQAEAILDQARQQAEELKARAKQEGYHDGKTAGAAEVSQAIAQSIARAESFEAAIVPQFKEIALRIARKVLGKELEFHPEAVVNIVRQALSEKARQRHEVSLRVHPDDLAIIREHKPELLEVLSRAKTLAIREDAEVQRHGVIIETDAGTIDAQLDTQLAIFEKILRDAG